jgi:hypothetical protein
MWRLCVISRGMASFYERVDEIVGSAFAFVLQRLIGSSEL